MDGFLAQTLLALAGILAAARLIGWLAVRLRQPRIAGEMLAGLLVGGALLSPWRHAGAAHAAVLSTPVVRFIDLLGQVGMILYLLLVGLTVSPLDLRRNVRRIAAVAFPVMVAAGALAPFAAAWFTGARWQLAGGPAAGLVMAAALLVNGFPFVARILQERGSLDGEFGATVLGASALLTALAFVLLAVAERRFPSNGVALLGAFLVGIALSRSTGARTALERGLDRGVPVLLVPVFLAATGARLDPRILDAGVLAGSAVFTLLLVAVATLGGYASARISRVGPTDGGAITALINCRGLMLLALGAQMADHGLIGSRLVAVFFIGAIATTLMTGPLLARAQRLARRAASRDRVQPPSWLAPEIPAASDQRPPLRPSDRSEPGPVVGDRGLSSL